MNEELMLKMQEYSETFGDGFPMIPLGWGRSDEDIIALIDECIQDKKDVYEKGLVEDDMIY